MIDQSGIYEILNIINGKQYIGSAVNLRKRFNLHKHDLRTGSHCNKYLLRAWNKYGEAAFIFRPLLICAHDKDILHFYEQKCFDAFQPEYNLAPIAGSALGVKHSPETKERMSKAQKGHPVSQATRTILSELNKGKPSSKKGKHYGPLTPSQRAAVSKATIGKPKTAAHCAAISKGRTGMKFSAEHRTSLSIAHEGKPWSPARRAADNRKKEARTRNAETRRVRWKT